MSIFIEIVMFLFIFVLSLVFVLAQGEDNNNDYCYRSRDPYALIIQHTMNNKKVNTSINQPTPINYQIFVVQNDVTWQKLNTKHL